MLCYFGFGKRKLIDLDCGGRIIPEDNDSDAGEGKITLDKNKVNNLIVKVYPLYW